MRVLALTWIDTYSKNRVLNKINSIIPRIGYAPWIFNNTLLVDYYQAHILLSFAPRSREQLQSPEPGLAPGQRLLPRPVLCHSRDAVLARLPPLREREGRQVQALPRKLEQLRNERRLPPRSAFPSPGTSASGTGAAGENTINVYLGIMQPPIFDFGYPLPMVYGILGFVIAHEITHSVDTQGPRRRAP